MNILISGIQGFVGNNLVAALKNQHIIYGLDILSPLKDGILKTYNWDEMDQIPPVDMIIHLAGKAHDTRNITEEKAYFDINVGLTKKIFNHFIKSSATKFIFFSSVKAVADSVSGNQLSEEDIPDPQTPYGKSKLEAERYLTTRLQEYTNTREGDFTREREGDKETSRLHDFTTVPLDKIVYILRPCMIHGPGNKGNLNLLYKLAQIGLPWPLGAFENNRSFTSMENLQFVIQQLIEKDIEPGTYQIADDEPLSTNQLIELIAASQGNKTRIWKINTKLITFAAHVGDKLHLPLNSERLKKLTESYVVSNQKIKRGLGIEKMPISAEEGMKKTLTSF